MKEAYTFNKSQELLLRAGKVIPAGVYGHQGPAEGCMIPIDAFPKFSTKAKGSHFWDVDGNEFIDYMCAYGPNVLGYCDDDVDAAFAKQAAIGNCVTSPSYLMIEFAEKLVDTVASADWAFFAKNGSDVTTFAMLIARVATGKEKIICFRNYYHGIHQWTQFADSPWVVSGEVDRKILVDFNDIEGLEKVMRENDDIGALIATPYMHGNFIDNELPKPGFWKKVRELCTKHNIILIIDDVRTGFRLDMRGSDFYYGFEADLNCFCKVLANGYSVSALCGKEFLKNSAASIAYTGSYWLSAAHFAAGIACLDKMKKLGGGAKHRELGKKVCDQLASAAKNNGVHLSITGEPSLFYLLIKDDDSLLLHQEWISLMVRHGIFMTNHHNHFTNLSLTDEDIKKTGEVADDAFRELVKNHPEVHWGAK